MKALNTLLAKHGDKIDSVSNEARSGDGYWLFLKPGWSCDEVHSVHEWNMRDMRAAFQNVQPCTCADCCARLEAVELTRIDALLAKSGVGLGE